MREALRAQLEGRAIDAAQRYRQVLSAEPTNFDATHMLGLVEYEVGDYDEAISLVRRAIELRPDLGAPRRNLQLLESLPMMEVELCREVLSRMLERIETSFDTARLAAARNVHIVTGPLEDAERDALATVVKLRGSGSTTRWSDCETDSEGDAAAKHPTPEVHPRGGWLVFVGPVRPATAWLHGARAEGIVVVATRDEPCAILDRIEELAASGYPSPALLCSSPALARRLGLPASCVLSR